jgi:hypothetical protein
MFSSAQKVFPQFVSAAFTCECQKTDTMMRLSCLNHIQRRAAQPRERQSTWLSAKRNFASEKSEENEIKPRGVEEVSYATPPGTTVEQREAQDSSAQESLEINPEEKKIYADVRRRAEEAQADPISQQPSS